MNVTAEGTSVGPGGGTVTSSDQEVQIVIPPGALSQETIITIQEAFIPPPGHIGKAYEFGPQGLTFELPVTISITYDEASLPAGLNEVSLRLGTVLNGARWCELLGTTIDTVANTVTGTTHSFSTYGLVIGSFSATLEGSQEVPASASNATGAGVFSIDTAQNMFSYQISYEGLEGEEQSAYIYGPASRGQTGGMLHTLPVGPQKVGIWIYDESLEQDILAGRIYVNIYTSTYADGEIRSQIEPLAPEGTTSTVTLRIALWDDLSSSGPFSGVPPTVNSLKVRVSGPGMAQVEQWITFSTGLIEEAVIIPKGVARRIEVMAYDSTDQLIYKTSKLADISTDTDLLDVVMISASDVMPPALLELPAQPRLPGIASYFPGPLLQMIKLKQKRLLIWSTLPPPQAGRTLLYLPMRQNPAKPIIWFLVWRQEKPTTLWSGPWTLQATPTQTPPKDPQLPIRMERGFMWT